MGMHSSAPLHNGLMLLSFHAGKGCGLTSPVLQRNFSIWIGRASFPLWPYIFDMEEKCPAIEQKNKELFPRIHTVGLRNNDST